MFYPTVAYKTKDLLEKNINRKIVISRHIPFIILRKRFLSVRMDVTSRCNLKCLICPRSASDKGFDMQWELFEKIAENVFPKTSELFLSCTSEPLVAKNFLDVLEVVGKAEIPFVAFSTNALLLNETIIRKVIASGINEIYISFDGGTEETFAKIRGGASINKVMEKIKLFNHVKKSLSVTTPRIEFHTTLMRSNIDEIVKIIEIAHDLEIGRVSARHVYPFAHLGISEESLYNYKDYYDSRINVARKRAEELGVSLDFPPMFNTAHSAAHGRGCETSKKRHCLLPWTALRIRPDGKVVPCTYWQSKETFGDLNESSFSAIWYGAPYQSLRREIRTNKLRNICAHCPGLQF